MERFQAKTLKGLIIGAIRTGILKLRGPINHVAKMETSFLFFSGGGVEEGGVRVVRSLYRATSGKLTILPLQHSLNTADKGDHLLWFKKSIYSHKIISLHNAHCIILMLISDESPCNNGTTNRFRLLVLVVSSQTNTTERETIISNVRIELLS